MSYTTTDFHQHQFQQQHSRQQQTHLVRSTRKTKVNYSSSFKGFPSFFFLIFNNGLKTIIFSLFKHDPFTFDNHKINFPETKTLNKSYFEYSI